MARATYGILRDNGTGTGMVDNGNGWHHPHAARAMCPDGKVRTVRLSQAADTFFTWPARGRATAGGRTVRGYVGYDSMSADPGMLRFYPLTPRYT